MWGLQQLLVENWYFLSKSLDIACTNSAIVATRSSDGR